MARRAGAGVCRVLLGRDPLAEPAAPLAGAAQFDGGASLLSDMFTDEPDFAPYAAVGVRPAVFDPAKALDPLDADFDWSGVNEYPTLDNYETLREQLDQEADVLDRR